VKGANGQIRTGELKPIAGDKPVKPMLQFRSRIFWAKIQRSGGTLEYLSSCEKIFHQQERSWPAWDVPVKWRGKKMLFETSCKASSGEHWGV